LGAKLEKMDEFGKFSAGVMVKLKRLERCGHIAQAKPQLERMIQDMTDANIPTVKHCSQCQTPKLVSQFSRDK
jgi:hypothetical protein